MVAFEDREKKADKPDPANPNDPRFYGPAGALRDAVYQQYLNAHPGETQHANADQITGLTLTINHIAAENVAEHAKRQASERTRSSVEAAATHTATHVPDNMLNGNLREVIWAVLGAESISFADRLQMAEQIEGDLFREDRATTTASGLRDTRMNTPHTEARRPLEMKSR